MNKTTLTPAKVKAPWFDENPSFDCWSDGETWNCHQCPWMTAAQLDEYVKYQNEHPTDECDRIFKTMDGLYAVVGGSSESESYNLFQRTLPTGETLFDVGLNWTWEASY